MIINRVWSDFYYFVWSRCLMLQHVVTGCCHTISGRCTSCQERLVYENPLVNGKLWYPCYHSVVVTSDLGLLPTRYRVYTILQCVDSMMWRQSNGPGL